MIILPVNRPKYESSIYTKELNFAHFTDHHRASIIILDFEHFTFFLLTLCCDLIISQYAHYFCDLSDKTVGRRCIVLVFSV